MSALDAEILNKVRQWFIYAHEDLILARHGLTLATGTPYRLIAYHAQQCAENVSKHSLYIIASISLIPITFHAFSSSAVKKRLG